MRYMTLTNEYSIVTVLWSQACLQAVSTRECQNSNGRRGANPGHHLAKEKRSRAEHK